MIKHCKALLLILFLFLLSAQSIFAVRYYDSATGRWLSVDPKAGKYPGLSLYNYAKNNPLRYTDPNGKDPTGVTESAVVVVSAVAILTALTIHTVEYTTNSSYRSRYISYLSSTSHLLSNSVTQIGNFIGNLFSTGESNKQSDGKTQENTNPYTGPVTQPVTVIDPNGNAIPVKAGEQIKTSPDGKWVDGKETDGKTSTKNRIDNGHSGHSDSRAQKPHAHRKGITNPDGTPWLPIK